MVKFWQERVSGSKNRSLSPNRLIVMVIIPIFLGVVAGSLNPIQAELDLADIPLLALVKSPPPNLMFVLDDSGSMTYEVLIKGQFNGRYPSPLDKTTDNSNGFCYIFDYPGDNAYAWNDGDDRDQNNNLRYMLAEYRTFWKSQYYGENVMYYNPYITYDPWTGYGDVIFSDADKENPTPHPTKGSALDLDAKSFTVKLKIDAVTVNDFAVKHAHYYDKSESGDIYLVVIDGVDKKINYFRAIETAGTGFAEKITMIEEADPSDLPAGIAVKSDYDRQRRNFANWFTYHRRREYVAKASLAKVIKSLKDVRVGILGINGEIIMPLKPVNAKIGGIRSDDSDSILEQLYEYDSQGGTPLREGLNDVGRYYRTNSIRLTHFLGGESEESLPPYFSQAEGGACQQCFSIIMTDGYYSTLGNLGAGNADGTDNPTEFDRKALADNLANTLADIAMYYYENDLSPQSIGDDSGLSNLVPTAGFDGATHQHMVTFGVTFGVDGNINPDDYTDKMNLIYTEDAGDDDDEDDGLSIPWPKEINIRQAETIDDLYHATLNGRGQFFSADNPQHLTDSLIKLTETITAPLSGSASAVTINGSQLFEEISEDIRLFQCSFSSENEEWTGEVKAYGFNTDTGKLDTDRPLWSAAKELEEKLWNERNIATYNPDEKVGQIFDYGRLTDEQKKTLGWDSVAASAAEATASNRVAFIKGKIVNGFRSRSQKLGDIVHSDPTYENDVVYVGGNDGMLHAFNSKEFDSKQSSDPVPGEELFAYIPNLVFENLIELTKSDYNHKFFVDQTPTVKKGRGLLEGNPPKTASGDQTILVCGLGKGGKGYFALDVTDPFSMDTAEKVAQKVLWEFSVATDEDMGYSYSKPVVVRSNDEDHPWIVLFGNGYNSKNGYAVLYILDPTQKPGEGLLIKKFEMINGSDNGLSSPTAVDVDFDHVVDYVYAGDLNGNLWKFDLTAESVADWKVAFNHFATPKPLFQAVGPDNFNQPITSKPEITFHPQKYSHGTHGYLVLFATGKFLGVDDAVDDRVQSVYGIWDYGDDEDDSESLGALNRKEDTLSLLSNNVTLLKQEITDFAYTLPNGDVADVRVLSDKEVKWEIDKTNDPGQQPNPHQMSENHVGWYFDLSARERVDQDVVLRDGKLIVIGWIPDKNLCLPGGGDSMFMEFNAFTGGNLDMVQFDLTNGGILNQYDYVNDPKAADPATAELIPPAGLLYRGKLQKPAILRIDNAFRKPDNPDDHAGLDKAEINSFGCGEEKYFSTSTGRIRTVCEKAVSLGIGYWKEVGRDE